jgi:hypothetical protein
VEEGPIPAIHGVVRWRACDLIMRLYEEFRLSVSDDTIHRALKKLGFSHMSASECRGRYLACEPQSDWAARARRPLKFCEKQVHLSAS